MYLRDPSSKPERTPEAREDIFAAGALIASSMGLVVLYVGSVFGFVLAIYVLKTLPGRPKQDKNLAITAIVVGILSFIVSIYLTWVLIQWDKQFPRIG